MNLWTVQPQCGHTFVVEHFPGEWEPCPECGCEVKLYAVECREWKAACNNCSYARWAGSSQQVANGLVTAHGRSRPAHVMRVDFLAHPGKHDELKRTYGRAVKPWIIGVPTVARVLKRYPMPEEPPF